MRIPIPSKPPAYLFCYSLAVANITGQNTMMGTRHTRTPQQTNHAHPCNDSDVIKGTWHYRSSGAQIQLLASSFGTNLVFAHLIQFIASHYLAIVYEAIAHYCHHGMRAASCPSSLDEHVGQTQTNKRDYNKIINIEKQARMTATRTQRQKNWQTGCL